MKNCRDEQKLGIRLEETFFIILTTTRRVPTTTHVTVTTIALARNDILLKNKILGNTKYMKCFYSPQNDTNLASRLVVASEASLVA